MSFAIVVDYVLVIMRTTIINQVCLSKTFDCAV